MNRRYPSNERPFISIDISPNIQSRLLASAQAEGMSLEAFLERLIDEREELTAAIERAEGHLMPLSEKQIEAKIERGLLQSERGEVVDGDSFTAGLLSEISEMEHKRQAG